MFDHIHDPSARVRALCEYGGQVEVDSAIPPRRYLRSGNEMLRMASVYVEEHKLEQAFILYTKFITLFVEKLPKHPDYKSYTGKEKAVNRQKLKDIFPKAETIKDKLKKRYEIQEQKRLEIEQERKKEEELARQEDEARLREQMKQDADSRMREEGRKRQEYEDQMRRQLSEQEQQYLILQEIERQKLKDKEKGVNDALDRPAVIGVAGLQIGEQVPNVPPPSYGSVLADQTTGLPFKPSVPHRDLKPTPSAPPPTQDFSNTKQVPSVDRGNKPLHHFTSVGDTSNPYGLHGVQVPTELMVKFLNIAQSNTLQNLETGGFLFGKLAHEEFHITHLIIPKQTGSPDSFTDLSDEDQLWDIQEKHDVVQLGWIHTHPSQTAFLSSVDQHVQASFQCMLPESIAVVCSPKHQETGIFYLTPDYGLNFIRNCKQKGFHPHPSNPAIFETCSHAVLNPSGRIMVIDLRTK